MCFRFTKWFFSRKSSILRIITRILLLVEGVVGPSRRLEVKDIVLLFIYCYFICSHTVSHILYELIRPTSDNSSSQYSNWIAWHLNARKLQIGFNSHNWSFWFLSFYLLHVHPLLILSPPLCLLLVLGTVPSRCPTDVSGLCRGLQSVNVASPCWSLFQFLNSNFKVYSSIPLNTVKHFSRLLRKV
jgi:hypothetical protein